AWRPPNEIGKKRNRRSPLIGRRFRKVGGASTRSLPGHSLTHFLSSLIGARSNIEVKKSPGAALKRAWQAVQRSSEGRSSLCCSQGKQSDTRSGDSRHARKRSRAERS